MALTLNIENKIWRVQLEKRGVEQKERARCQVTREPPSRNCSSTQKLKLSVVKVRDLFPPVAIEFPKNFIFSFSFLHPIALRESGRIRGSSRAKGEAAGKCIQTTFKYLSDQVPRESTIPTVSPPGLFISNNNNNSV